MGWYDRRTRRVRDLPCGDARLLLEIDVRRVRCKSCGHVKRERLDVLADKPFYTKLFAYYVGRRCRQATIKDVAEEFRLHWETIKTLEMQYIRAQLAKANCQTVLAPMLRIAQRHNASMKSGYGANCRASDAESVGASTSPTSTHDLPLGDGRATAPHAVP